MARFPVKHARERYAASTAMALVRELPFAQLVPVPLDEPGAAAVAVGAAAGRVVDVTGIAVAQAVADGDVAGPGERLRRGVGTVRHLVVRMEGGEVQGHVRSEPLHDPAGLRLDLRVGVVQTGDE